MNINEENYRIIWDRNKLDNIGLNEIARALNLANAILKILHLHMQQYDFHNISTLNLYHFQSKQVIHKRSKTKYVKRKLVILT